MQKISRDKMLIGVSPLYLYIQRASGETGGRGMKDDTTEARRMKHLAQVGIAQVFTCVNTKHDGRKNGLSVFGSRNEPKNEEQYTKKNNA